MSARFTITLSHTSVWLLFLACIFALPVHAGGFHWRDILRDAARDEVREYRAPDRRSDETRNYRGDEPRDRYDGWREQRAAEWQQREEAAARARQEEQEREAAQRREQEAERARQEEEQRRQEATERERQLLLEQQQREEAAARERDELARQRLIAQQQEEQRAAEQARLEREQQQLVAERLRQEQARQEWEAALRQAPVFLLMFYLFFGAVAAFVPRYRSYWDERAGGGVGQFLWGGKLLSLLALGAFTWMVFSGLSSSNQASLALILGLIGLPAMLFAPWLLITFAQYLHYLFAPHPMESPVRKAMTEHDPSKVRLGDVTDAMFDYERDELPPKWQSENYARRLDALEKRIRGEKAAVDGLSEYLRKKSG